MKKELYKHFISILFFVCSISSIAKSDSICLGEAQVIAKVSLIKWLSPTLCIAYIDPANVKYYNQSRVCPIDLVEVVQSGITGKHIDQGVCQFTEGEEISGVLSKSNTHVIYLE